MDPGIWEYLKYVLGAIGTFGALIITSLAVYVRSKDKEHNTNIVAAFDKVTASLESLIKTMNDNSNMSREDLLKHRLRLEATLEKVLNELKDQDNADPKKGS